MLAAILSIALAINIGASRDVVLGTSEEAQGTYFVVYRDGNEGALKYIEVPAENAATALRDASRKLKRPPKDLHVVRVAGDGDPDEIAVPRLKADAPTDIRDYYSRCVLRHVERVESKRNDVRLAKVELRHRTSGRVVRARTDSKQGPQGSWLFPSQEEKDKYVQEQERHCDALKQELARLINGEMILPAIMPHAFDGTGSLGQLTFRVVQVIDERTAIVQILTLDTAAELNRNDQRAAILARLVPMTEEDRRRLLEDLADPIYRLSEPYWLTGFDTTGWSDGGDSSTNGLGVMEQGTHTYETATRARRTLKQLVNAHTVLQEWLVSL